MSSNSSRNYPTPPFDPAANGIQLRLECLESTTTLDAMAFIPTMNPFILSATGMNKGLVTSF